MPTGCSITSSLKYISTQELPRVELFIQDRGGGWGGQVRGLGRWIGLGRAKGRAVLTVVYSINIAHTILY